MSTEPITLRQQAQAVECCFLEWRNSADELSRKPIGKGGLDPAAMKLRRIRIEVLEAAAATLHRAADRADARRSTDAGKDAA